MQKNPSSRSKCTILLVLASAAALSPAAFAASSGPTSTVVYVSGNDLVLKAADGKVLNYTVPAGYKFTAGDKQVTLDGLQPGIKLTAPVATGVDPQVVASISVLQAKVYGTAPPDTVTLTTPQGAKDFLVPTGATFLVGGKPTPLAALKDDTLIDATVITPAAADADPGPAPVTPPLTGTLLVTKTDDLPLAGTHLPLYGLAGLALLLLGFALLRFRQPAPGL